MADNNSSVSTVQAGDRVFLVGGGDADTSKRVHAFSPTRFVRGLLRRWLIWSITGPLVGLLAGAYAWYSQVPGYVATAYLRVRSTETSLVQTARSYQSADSATFRDTQAEVVTMPHVLRRTLDDPEFKVVSLGGVNSIVQLRKRLRVDFPGRSEVMQISVVHENPMTAKLLANAVARSYLEETLQLESPDRQKDQDELGRQYTRLEEQLQEKWKQLQELAKELGSGTAESLTIREQNQLESYRDYAQRLRKVGFEVRDAELTLANLKENGQSLSDARITAAIEGDAAIVAQRQKLSDLQQMLAEAELLDGDGEDAGVLRLRQQVERARTGVEQLRESLRESVQIQIESLQASERSQELEDLEVRVKSLREEEKYIEEMLAEIENERINVGGDNSIQLEMLRRDIDRMQTMADNLWTAKESMVVGEQSRPRVKLIAEAAFPQISNETSRLKWACLFAVAGCGGVGLVIGAWEYQVGRITQESDLEGPSQTSVVATVPRMTKERATQIGNREGIEDPDWQVRDSLDGLVMRLLSSREDNRTIMVTSALPNEGKSTVSMHLAAAFARAGKRTLLIDFDLERPSLADMLQTEIMPGVADVCGGRCELGQAVVVVGHDLLGFVPAGDQTIDARKTLMQPALKRFFAQIDESYDHIIVDTPPILAAVDSLVLAPFVDTALFVVMSSKSKRECLLSACQRIRSVNIPLFGVIINGVEGRQDHYNYYRHMSAYRQNQIQFTPPVKANTEQ